MYIKTRQCGIVKWKKSINIVRIHPRNIHGTQNKIVITIIFDHKLWSCKRAYRYVSLERRPIWEYPKIRPWFEIMTSVDAVLRSGRRFESGRRSESIIYDPDFSPSLSDIWSWFFPVVHCLIYDPDSSPSVPYLHAERSYNTFLAWLYFQNFEDRRFTYL